jgi:hypothetical protein
MEQAHEPERGSWWSRNWKWIVPVGCLTPILVCGGFLTLILVFVFGLIRSSEPYTHSLEAARANPGLREAIGAPMEPDFLVTGSIETSGPSGTAELAYGLTGPDGEATVYVIARKQAGQWEYRTLEAELAATGERIDLR